VQAIDKGIHGELLSVVEDGRQDVSDVNHHLCEGLRPRSRAPKGLQRAALTPNSTHVVDPLSVPGLRVMSRTDQVPKSGSPTLPGVLHSVGTSPSVAVLSREKPSVVHVQPVRMVRVTDDVDVNRDLDRGEVLEEPSRVVRAHSTALCKSEEGEGEVLLRSGRVPAGRPTVVQGKVIDPRGLQMPASRQDLHVPDQVKEGLALPLFDVPRGNQLQVAFDHTLNRLVPAFLGAVRLRPGVRSVIDLLSSLSLELGHSVSLLVGCLLSRSSRATESMCISVLRSSRLKSLSESGQSSLPNLSPNLRLTLSRSPPKVTRA